MGARLNEKKILIIDNDHELNEWLRNALVKRGAIVSTAQNGADGLRQFRTLQYLRQLRRDGLRQRPVALLGGRAGSADDDGQQARLVAVELAPVEDELAPVLPLRCIDEGVQRQVQAHAGVVLQVAGADGFRRERLHAIDDVVESCVVHALQQADRDFELMVYPQSRHGIGGMHYRHLMLAFIKSVLKLSDVTAVRSED